MTATSCLPSWGSANYRKRSDGRASSLLKSQSESKRRHIVSSWSESLQLYKSDSAATSSLQVCADEGAVDRSSFRAMAALLSTGAETRPSGVTTKLLELLS